MRTIQLTEIGMFNNLNFFGYRASPDCIASISSSVEACLSALEVSLIPIDSPKINKSNFCFSWPRVNVANRNLCFGHIYNRATMFYILFQFVTMKFVYPKNSY